MSAHHNQRKAWYFRRRCLSQPFPHIRFQCDAVWKELMIEQRGPIVKNRHVKIQLQRQRRYRLSDMARAGDPQRARRRNCFSIKQRLVISETTVQFRNAKVLSHCPRFRALPLSQFGPKLFPDLLRIRQNQSENLSSTNEPIIPTKIMVEQKIECRSLSRSQGLNRALLNFRLKASSTERSLNSSICIKKRLRSYLLRARTLDAGNDPERNWLGIACRFGESL